MLTRVLNRVLKTMAPGLVKRIRFRRMYDRIAAETDDRRFAFMNYGYAYTDGSGPALQLRPEDEPFRLNIQLYAETVKGADIQGSNILEVGSGRGGGSCYLKSYLNAASVVGVELSPSAVTACLRTYAVEGLIFRCGNAEALPFPSGSFDVVVNVESSHCYPDCARFFQEALRVLRPGGRFCYADFGEPARMQEVHATIRATGLEALRVNDITPNVIQSLLEGTKAMSALFLSIAGDDAERLRYLTHTWRIAGTPGYESFQKRREVYWSSMFRK